MTKALGNKTSCIHKEDALWLTGITHCIPGAPLDSQAFLQPSWLIGARLCGCKAAESMALHRSSPRHPAHRWSSKVPKASGCQGRQDDKVQGASLLKCLEAKQRACRVGKGKTSIWRMLVLRCGGQETSRSMVLSLFPKCIG